MDIKKYEALITAVELGSFTRAADKLGYTQSGLTHMMNALETEVGFAVLERGHFGIRLTENGQRILPYIQKLLAANYQLASQISNIQNHDSGTITIGSYASIASHWLPGILQCFRHECPNVRVETTAESRQNISNGVQSGHFDLGLTSKPLDQNFLWIPLHQDELLALLPKTSTPEDCMDFPVERYTGMQFLMPAFGFEVDAMSVLQKHNAAPEILNTSVSDQAIISMVGHGLGVSMLSELCIRGYEDHIQALPLRPRYHRQLGILLPKDTQLKPTTQKFIHCARAAMQDLY